LTDRSITFHCFTIW